MNVGWVLTMDIFTNITIPMSQWRRLLSVHHWVETLFPIPTTRGQCWVIFCCCAMELKSTCNNLYNSYAKFVISKSDILYYNVCGQQMVFCLCSAKVSNIFVCSTIIIDRLGYCCFITTARCCTVLYCNFTHILVKCAVHYICYCQPKILYCYWNMN
jgi:hypothetical protein